MQHRYWLLMIVILLVVPSGVRASTLDNQQASGETCPAIVEAALDAVDTLCASAGRNQACYGNVQLEAEPQPNVADFQFNTAGDKVAVNDIAALRLSPMDEEAALWGVALMRLQANLPDTLPGQNVTFILYGDVEVINAIDPEAVLAGDAAPMQAFYLTTGIGDARCNEAPDSGVLVQTPEGVGEIAFTVNEVAVEMGSTVLFQAQPGGEMVVTTIEGSAALTLADRVLPVLAGTRLRVPLDDLLRPLDGLFEPESYDLERLQSLPLNLLERAIDIRAPFTVDELQDLRNRFEEGLALCGEGPFPACENVPRALGGLPCLLTDDPDASTDDSRPLCDFAALRDGLAGALDGLDANTTDITVPLGAVRTALPDGDDIINLPGTGDTTPGDLPSVPGGIDPRITPDPSRTPTPTPTTTGTNSIATPTPRP